MTTVLAADPRRARIGRVGKFVIVGVVGLVVNLVVQAGLTEVVGLNYLISAVLATPVSSTVNFVIADVWVFAGGEGMSRMRRYLSFVAMSMAALALRAPMMWVLTHYLGVHYTVSNLISLVVLTLVRFGIADAVIWKMGTAPAGDDVVLAAEVALLPAPPPGDVELGRLARARVALGERFWPLATARQMETPEVVTLEPEHRRPRTTRWQWLLLAGIMLVAEFLRLWKLMGNGFNSDEAVYAGQAASIAGDPALTSYFPVFRAHPLLFQTVMSVFYHAGTSDVVGRVV